MEKFLRVYRDPDPAAQGAGDQAPAAALPKTKEEWDRLADSDPKQWIKLTQPRMDQAIREAREAKEKVAVTENKYKNIETELTNLKGNQAPPVVDDHEPKPFSRENLPNTKEDWDQLAVEDPTLAMDLRQEYNERVRQNRDRQTQVQREFHEEQKKHRTELQKTHPDLFVAEINADGTPKVDAEGKPVLKIDLASGEPIPNLESEKGKLWVEIFQEDPDGYLASKRGPRLMRLEMERRLRERGELQIASQNDAAKPDQRGVIPQGLTPPVTAKVSFISDEEKAHAQRAVERGVYKNVEEYCRLRDGKNTGIVEENRFPQFTK